MATLYYGHTYYGHTYYGHTLLCPYSPWPRSLTMATSSLHSIFVGGVNTDLAAAAAAALKHGGEGGEGGEGSESSEGGEGGEGAIEQLTGAVGRRLFGHVGVADHMHPELMDGMAGEEMMDEACQQLATKYGSNVFRGMKELFEITLGGAESGLECLDELRHSGTSTFVMSLFLISSVVLLLNMLIAMMAKTFDRVFDKQPQARATTCTYLLGTGLCQYRLYTYTPQVYRYMYEA